MPAKHRLPRALRVGSGALAATATILTILMMLAGAGCARPWEAEVLVDRATVAIPDRIDFEIIELLDARNRPLGTTELSFSGAEFFAEEGVTNRLPLEVSREATAVRVRSLAYDAAGTLLGSGAGTLAQAPEAAATVRLWEPGTLEIGLDGGGAGVDVFVPLADGDTAPAIQGPNGFFMIRPCFRTTEIDLADPVPSVEVTMEGVVAGAERSDVRRDFVSDGVGSVLWNVDVVFQMEPCCINCREGLLEARIEDSRGKIFLGEVSVVVARGPCPDPGVCCFEASYCIEELPATYICQ